MKNEILIFFVKKFFLKNFWKIFTTFLSTIIMFLKVAADSASKIIFSEQKDWKCQKNGRVDHFQPPFSTLFGGERPNFKRVPDSAELGDYFKHKNFEIDYGITRTRREKLKKSLFDPKKNDVLEFFLNFFFMNSRF